MPRAVILNTASKANTTGGTFADSLSANSGDSLAVGNYDTGGARVIGAWGIDSDSVAELSWYYTRPESTIDQTYGLRVNIPALVPGGAGSVASHRLIGQGADISVYKSDTATMKVTSTAGDDVLVSWLTEYDDLPGVSAMFATYEQVQNYKTATAGYACNAVASATAGAYGASRAINADDTRWVSDTYYAILGFSVQTQVTTIAMKGYDWGSQLFGAPAGALDTDIRMFFVQLARDRHAAYIPILSSNNVGNTFLYVADGEASTSPKIDVYVYQLSRQFSPSILGGV